MTTALAAAIRPDDWNLPVFLHVLGAMLLVGTLATAATFLLAGWLRDRPGQTVALGRLGFRTLLFAGVPSYLLMRLAAEWARARMGLGDADPTWITIGYLVADAGLLLMLISLVLAGIGARRLRTSDGKRAGLTRAAAILALVLLAGYLVAVWAMTVKPG